MRPLQQFLEMMAVERGATRSTLSAYEADLRNFYDFLKGQEAESVTFQDIQSYLMTQSHLSGSTVARRLSTLRQFYTFLISKGKVTENPLRLVETTYHKPETIPFLTEKDVTRLLEGAKRGEGAEGKRLSVLLQIFYETDMSVNDLVALPLTVDYVEGLSSSALEALQAYRAVRAYFLPHGKESPWLFPSQSQKGHLTRQRFGQLLKELAVKVGLDADCFSLAMLRRELHHFKKF